MRFFSLLWLAALVPACAAAPRLLYTKTFPGSTPAYVSIGIDQQGNAVYKEAAGDDSPLRFRLRSEDTALIFALAAKLGHFGRPLESNLKVARMGTKTFRWEDGADSKQTEFNYTLDPDGQALLDWFERIGETGRNWIELDTAVHFDKLGVDHVLIETEVAWDRKRLIAPERFLPLLDRIAKNESFLHMARERAARLAEEFRKPPVKPAA